MPSMTSVIRTAARCHRVVVTVREALRLELARRESGELPPARREVDGVKIDVKETNEAIVLTVPGLDGADPFVITLRR